MKIIFAGTPAFAVPTLKAIHHAGYEIVSVYTQPDKPAGRGQKLMKSPVKIFAEQHHLMICQPSTFKDEAAQEQLKTFQADIMVVVAYGLILPEAVLAIPKLGCINVHASLLPRWRGAAPIERAMIAGDQTTGITIMQMAAGLDTGPMLLQHAIPIEAQDTGHSLTEKLSILGAKMLLHTLTDFQNEKVHPVPQNDAFATYAKKIEKQEALIDWQKSAIELERLVRAFNARPVASTQYEHQVLKIWQAKVLDAEKISEKKPGTILMIDKHGVDVATGKGILRLEKIQLAGGNPLSIAQLLNGRFGQVLIVDKQFST